VVRFLVALAILLALAVAYLGYRVVALERRLDEVNAQLGAPDATPGPSGASGGSKLAPAGGPAKPAAGLEPRLAQLETKVSSLSADVSSLEAATESTLNLPPADPKQILSVVGSEVNRIRDKQLEFQHAQWVKWRRRTLALFATDHALSDEQRAALDRLTTDELDRWIELLRREDLIDKPDQLAAEARAALRDTDEDAREVLNADQYLRWIQLRAMERHALWPFLPE
jgi:hypothetical protein